MGFLLIFVFCDVGFYLRFSLTRMASALPADVVQVRALIMPLGVVPDLYIGSAKLAVYVDGLDRFRRGELLLLTEMYAKLLRRHGVRVVRILEADAEVRHCSCFCVWRVCLRACRDGALLTENDNGGDASVHEGAD